MLHLQCVFGWRLNATRKQAWNKSTQSKFRWHYVKQHVVYDMSLAKYERVCFRRIAAGVKTHDLILVQGIAIIGSEHKNHLRSDALIRAQCRCREIAKCKMCEHIYCFANALFLCGISGKLMHVAWEFRQFIVFFEPEPVVVRFAPKCVFCFANCAEMYRYHFKLIK